MTAEWHSLTQLPIGGRLPATVDTITNLLALLAKALELATTALQVLKGLELAALNLIEGIVEAGEALLEELLFDLLEYNVGLAFHTNVNWNPFWVYNKERERDPRTGRVDPRLIDYENDGQLPWSGSGLTGWLLDVLASSKDPTNPFRPVTDENTNVYGVVIVKGIANPAEAEQSLGLEDWAKLFTNWDGFRLDFGTVSSSEYFDSLSKLGTTALLESLAALYQLGPKDKQMLPVQQFLTDETRSFFPTPGTYPKWISVPTAALVPPLGTAIDGLRKVLGELRPSDNPADSLNKVIELINAKVDTLEEGLEEATNALNLLLSIAAFLADAYIVVDKTSGGGMDRFISDILAATDAPDFGTAGIVVGITLVATQPDAQAALDKFLELLGVKTSAFLADATAQKNALDETFQDLFP